MSFDDVSTRQPPAASVRGAIALVILVCAQAPVTPAWAWGDFGHMIVCDMALQLLEPAERAKVADLATKFRMPDGSRYDDFPASCTFADLARTKAKKHAKKWEWFSSFSGWHYLNAPRDAQKIEASQCGDNCVFTGIDYHTARLAADEEQRRARALLFLAHWIGDVHQPLHVSYADDQGGNLITPITGGYYSAEDLHAVWDTGIITQQLGNKSWKKYADQLRAGITPEMRESWRGATPLEWARESYAITTSLDVEYCKWEEIDDETMCAPEGKSRKLDGKYQAKFKDVVERRLQQAAVRLAEKLHASFGS